MTQTEILIEDMKQHCLAHPFDRFMFWVSRASFAAICATAEVMHRVTVPPDAESPSAYFMARPLEWSSDVPDGCFITRIA